MAGAARLMAALAAGLALALPGGLLAQAHAAAGAGGGARVRSLVTRDAPAADPASLAITSSVSPSPLVVGEVGVYTVTVQNTGTPAATDVVTTLPFAPAGSVAVQQLGPADRVRVRRADGDLHRGRRSRPAARSPIRSPSPCCQAFTTGRISSCAARRPRPAGVRGHGPDHPGVHPGRRGDHQSGPATAGPGGPITYTITVKNNGPSDAATVNFTDPTNGNLTTITSYPCGNTGLTVTCQIGTMTPGETRVYELTVKVNNDVPAGTVITNCATVDTGTRPETNPDNNSSCTDTYIDPVTPVADVEVTKRAGHGGRGRHDHVHAERDQPRTRRRRARDRRRPRRRAPGHGGVAAAGCAAVSGTVICDAGNLAVNQTKTFTFTVKVADGLAAGTQITDCAQVKSTRTLLRVVQRSPPASRRSSRPPRQRTSR